MSVPQKCTVLIIGGGPVGSYVASALARGRIYTVVLKADEFPRYHIGESTLPSLRHFFKFIDFYEIFDKYGFYHKNGAVFRLAQGQPDAYTDFLEAGGSDAYAWGLIRSEARGTERRLVESFTRFFLAVSSATKQIRKQHESIIQDMNEEGFQRAFDLFRPNTHRSNTYTPIANSCHETHLHC